MIETKLPGHCAGCGARVYWVSNRWRNGPSGHWASHTCSGVDGTIGAVSGGRAAQTADPQATPDDAEATVQATRVGA